MGTRPRPRQAAAAAAGGDGAWEARNGPQADADVQSARSQRCQGWRSSVTSAGCWDIWTKIARSVSRMARSDSLNPEVMDSPRMWTGCSCGATTSIRPVSIAESQPALKVSFNRPRPRSQPARAGGPGRRARGCPACSFFFTAINF
jgi:hypothetical protein